MDQTTSGVVDTRSRQSFPLALCLCDEKSAGLAPAIHRRQNCMKTSDQANLKRRTNFCRVSIGEICKQRVKVPQAKSGAKL